MPFAHRGIIRYTVVRPRVSEFYGIAVCIYYRDHNPPHFHAIYGESEAIIDIRTGGILEGRQPRSAAKLVAEWCEIQRDALLADWALAQAQQPFLPIETLD
ncbi:DUF4160 domain-containing protein [Pirellulaceae bacterium SH501]